MEQGQCGTDRIISHATGKILNVNMKSCCSLYHKIFAIEKPVIGAVLRCHGRGGTAKFTPITKQPISDFEGLPIFRLVLCIDILSYIYHFYLKELSFWPPKRQS